MAESEPAYTWDVRAARYRDERGRFVPRDAVAANVDRLVAGTERELRILTERMRRGRLDIGAWQDAMAAQVAALHTAATAAGRGGWESFDAAARAYAERRIADQLGWLNRFATEVEAGYPDGRLGARAALYAAAGRATYFGAERDLLEGLYALERNVLQPGDACGGCIDATAADWVPLGTLPAIGERQCGVRCRCVLQYRDPLDVTRGEAATFGHGVTSLGGEALAGLDAVGA